MRKCYVIIGTEQTDLGLHTWVSAVKSSFKKATDTCNFLKTWNPECEYKIQVEVID